jgi:hypothetical protein
MSLNKSKVSVVLKELLKGVAAIVLTGDTGKIEFPDFDIDIQVKDNADATSFNVYGDINLKFLFEGKEVDVTITRDQIN